MIQEKDLKLTTVRLPKDLIKEIKKTAADLDISVQVLMTQSLKVYLKAIKDHSKENN